MKQKVKIITNDSSDNFTLSIGVAIAKIEKKNKKFYDIVLLKDSIYLNYVLEPVLIEEKDIIFIDDEEFDKYYNLLVNKLKKKTFDMEVELSNIQTYLDNLKKFCYE